MRILHVNNMAFTSDMLCKALIKKKHFSKVIDKDKYHKYDPRPYLKLIKELIFGKWDIIHIHYPATPMAALASLTGRRIVVHFHGTDTRGDSYRKALVKFVCRKAKIFLYSTPDLEANLNKLGFKQEKVFLPNYQPNRPNIYNKNNTKILIFAELNQKNKNLDAYDGELEQYGKVDAIFFGRDRLRYKKKWRKVNFIPKFPHRELENVLSKYKMVLGQRTGAIGNAELEAMSFGVPTFTEFHYNSAYSSPLPIATTPDPKIGARQRDWVQKQHSKRKALEILKEVYSKC